MDDGGDSVKSDAKRQSEAHKDFNHEAVLVMCAIKINVGENYIMRQQVEKF
jgi:hypothetical protein